MHGVMVRVTTCGDCGEGSRGHLESLLLLLFCSVGVAAVSRRGVPSLLVGERRVDGELGAGESGRLRGAAANPRWLSSFGDGISAAMAS